MMYGFMTHYEVSLLYYQKTTNSSVNRNLASVTSNWKDSSNCFYKLVNSNTYFCAVNMIYQHELLLWFKIKITNKSLNFIGG